MIKTEKSNNSLSYGVLCLYLFSLFLPRFDSFDYSTTQWFYLNIINLLVLLYVTVFNRSFIKVNFNKTVKYYFVLQVLLVLVSLVSLFNAVMPDVGVVQLNKVITFTISVFLLFLVLKNFKNFSFKNLSIIVVLFLSIEVLEVFYYFIKNYSTPRHYELIMAIPHRYGNINIIAVALVVKFPFLLYLLTSFKGYKRVLCLILSFILISDVLLISSRAAALSLGLGLVLYSLFYLFLSKKKYKILHVSVLFMVTCASVLYVVSINRIYEDRLNNYYDVFFPKNKQNLYSSSPVVSLINGSGRSEIWQSAINDFKSSPILGVGVGNWRHNNKMMLYKQSQSEKIVVHTFVHNDFLQALAETGVLGLLLYCSIFVFIIIKLFVKLKSKTNTDKFVYATLLAVLLVYFIDAFFNFPHDRAPIQLIYALLLALFLCLDSNSVKESKISRKQLAMIFSLLIVCGVSCSISFMDYKSSKINYKLISQIQTKDAFNDKFDYRYSEVENQLPTYPYINQIGMTTDDIKALFAFNDDLDEKGLQLLDRSILKNENNLWPRMLKGVYYSKHNKADSAFYYAKDVFNIYPSIEENFKTYRKLLLDKKDTLGLFKAYDTHLSYRPQNILGHLNMFNDLREFYKNDSLVLRKLNSLLKQFPRDESLIEYHKKFTEILKNPLPNPDKLSKALRRDQINEITKLYNSAKSLYDKKKYNEARELLLQIFSIDKNNPQAAFKLGQLESAVNNYTKALVYFTKVIDQKYLDNGRPEHNRGFIYYKMNDLENAKKDFLLSRKKGWPEALKIDDKFFK